MSFCGLRPKHKRHPAPPATEEEPEEPHLADESQPLTHHDGPINVELSPPKRRQRYREQEQIDHNYEDFDWTRGRQLSAIFEASLEGQGSRRTTLDWAREAEPINWDRNTAPRIPTLSSFESLIFEQRLWALLEELPDTYSMSSEKRISPDPARPIEPPPRDLELIARLDSALQFQNFTVEDAWELGCALRDRLLPIPTPVVINISLSNQNQTLFHACTHSGVMPDNDNWVARKRKTVLRWGVSTWYMHCKFDGDEVAFAEKYGLGSSAGEYAIHGGALPIRVVGVEGVVAVVVVSGLKQDQDHAVVVEVIKDLYC